MAKQQKIQARPQEDDFPDTSAGGAAPDAGPADAPPTGPPAPRRYRVTLACPTPLRDKELVVSAADDREACRLFDEHNGICGSTHNYTVAEVR